MILVQLAYPDTAYPPHGHLAIYSLVGIMIHVWLAKCTSDALFIHPFYFQRIGGLMVTCSPWVW